MTKFDFNNFEWYCDRCDAHLNNQNGFTGIYGSWTCKKCGYVNNINSENVLNDLGHAIEYILCVHCPTCNAHLELDGNNMVCPDCGYTCNKKYCEI